MPFPYECLVLADSIAKGVRLTTLQITFPRIVLAEFNTHRMLSRNSASSRAIPIERRIADVKADPFVPEAFGRNQRGMQAGAALDEVDMQTARTAWVIAMELAVEQAHVLSAAGVHKQWANRLIEPFSWHTVIVTATEWSNFFHLRISEHAQPEIRRAAEAMKAAMDASVPAPRESGEWHLPLTREQDWQTVRDPRVLAKLSVARCARVSYLTHDGRRDPDEDLRLHDQLQANGHLSPFEHAAMVGLSPLMLRHEFIDTDCINCGCFGPNEHTGPCTPRFIGNFRAPWVQYRKMLRNEADILGASNG